MRLRLEIADQVRVSERVHCESQSVFTHHEPERIEVLKRIILTGTSGAGKTSLIRELEHRGFYVAEESPTDVIALCQSKGVMEPWNSPDFIESVTSLQIKRQRLTEILPFEWGFFDRSPIDTLALATYLGFTTPKILSEELERIEAESVYWKQVFFIDNLGYCTPTEARRISFEDALKFEKIHMDTYEALGYECLRIPALPLEARADVILRELEKF